MRSTFTFLRVRGIPIGANWTWLLVFALVAWSLTAGLFPRTYPGLDETTYLAMGIVTAVLFFASILLHELGHAFRALKEGMEIDGITLWIFGGVARFKGMFPSAGAEGRIAIAGPVVSVVLVAAFAGLTALGNAAAWPGEVVGVTDYLARINAIVVGFNLVPALPLDGGRVLRAFLWHRQGSFTAATMSAAKAGRAFGGVLIGVGILGFITGSGIGGIWFAFLGWFLLQAAQSEASFALLKQSLGGIDVADLMTRDPATVDPHRTIADFVEDASYGRRHSSYPVVGGSGELLGLMALRLAGDVPPERRTAATVEEVMLRGDDVPVVRPGSPVFDVIDRLQEGPGRAVVAEDGRVVGILSRSDIMRALELEKVRGDRGEEPARRVPWFVWVVVAMMILGAGAYLFHPPLLVFEPGASFDVTEDISISGAAVDDVDGAYLLTSVQASQPNALKLALDFLQGDQIAPISALIPPGESPEDAFRQQREAFAESRRIAAAAAARAAGMEVRVSGNGARVLGVASGSPAAGSLEQGDVIVAANGNPVETATDLREQVGSRPEGTRFEIEVERNGSRERITLRSRNLPQAEGAVIGVIVQTADLEVDLPFEISFGERGEIGGSSAGSIYALAIADMLDPGDYADARRIAATGTISIDGEIGPVGGVTQKARAAEGVGADLFLVPASEVDAAREASVPVRGVGSLEEAIRVLRATA